MLVNNAGMSPLYPSVDQVSEALFDKVLGVNLKGPFRLTSLVGTRMAAGAGGSIINISSVEAERPEPSALPYAAAKAGLEALTLGFVRAFGPTVRVNTIRCGMFRTDIAKAWGDPNVGRRDGAATHRARPHRRAGRHRWRGDVSRDRCVCILHRCDAATRRRNALSDKTRAAAYALAHD